MQGIMHNKRLGMSRCLVITMVTLMLPVSYIATLWILKVNRIFVATTLPGGSSEPKIILDFVLDPAMSSLDQVTVG